MRFWGMLITGLVGFIILISLGIWQMQRLSWKQAVISEIADQIIADPVEIPLTPFEDVHEFLPVYVQGEYVGETIRVLASRKRLGAGYRLISALQTDAGRILIDRGFIKINADMPPLPTQYGKVVGNLHWPNEIDGFTPKNDIGKNIWFSRDVHELASHLNTRPILLVRSAGGIDDPDVTPWPVNIEGIPNDHLQYAITWFLLSIVWLGMTSYFLYLRIRTTK